MQVVGLWLGVDFKNLMKLPSPSDRYSSRPIREGIQEIVLLLKILWITQHTQKRKVGGWPRRVFRSRKCGLLKTLPWQRQLYQSEAY